MVFLGLKDFGSTLLPLQGFGPEAKTRGGRIEVPTYTKIVVYQMKSRLEQRRGAHGAVGKLQYLHKLNEAKCGPSNRFYKT